MAAAFFIVTLLAVCVVHNILVEATKVKYTDVKTKLTKAKQDLTTVRANRKDDLIQLENAEKAKLETVLQCHRESVDLSRWLTESYDSPTVEPHRKDNDDD